MDYSSPEELKKSIDKNKKNLREGLGGIASGINTEFSKATKQKVPASDVETELENLKLTDTAYLRLKKMLVDLNIKKIEADERLTTVLQKMLYDLENIRSSEQFIYICSENYSQTSRGFDQKLKSSIGDMRQNALNRLNYYHYKFAKAYEYRLLTPYQHALLLTSLFESFEELSKANSIQLSEDQIGSMVGIYREQLRQIVQEILDKYEKSSKEESIKRTIRITSNDIIDRLNRGETLEVNLSKMPEFVDPKEFNQRIISIVPKSVKTDEKNGTIDLDIIHEGISTFSANIEVLPDQRQKGIGRRLIEELLIELRKDNKSEIWLGTAKDNAPAQRLFINQHQFLRRTQVIKHPLFSLIILLNSEFYRIKFYGFRSETLAKAGGFYVIQQYA